MFQVTDIVVVLFITTIINFVATIVSWQRKRARSGLYFALGMMSLTLWSLAVGLGYASVPMELKIFFAKIDAVGYNFALVLFLFFAMYFAGLDKWADNKWLRALIFFIPVSNILLIWTNELHRWVWRGFRSVQDNVLVFEHGPGFLWVAVTGYVIFPTMIAILWWASRKGSEISRRQGRLLFYASVFPLLANMVYLYGVGGTEGVDWSSVTFSITGLLLLMTLYGQRLLDLVPIAREKLMADLSDGMIVLDLQGRIIDINRAAASMVQSSPEKLTGRTLEEVIPPVGSLPELISEQEIRTDLAVGDVAKRYFDVLISALQDERKKIIGRLIVFRDITERKQAEQASEQRFLEIQQLNKNLHETQAQLVEQQRALATMEERQRLARNLHDSVNQSIHGMVLFTDTLAATLEKNNLERARQIMDRLRESANQSLRETRLMLYELQGSGPERSVDLVRDLKDRLAMVESRVGVRTQLIQEGSLESCPLEWYENLFWIAVEALNNSLKHAQARSVQIMIRCSDQRLELEVIDDGKGFDTHKVEAGGLGLKNLRTRADIIGGTLDVESEPLKGTIVRFSAELKAKQNE